MTGWSHHEGLAVALPLEGVDTDQLIPARFMSRPREAGYGAFLLHDLRMDGRGAPRPDFPLNSPEAAEASIIVARRNFGAGSSREAAVYALVDAGIRAVVAPSFGDIFVGNAVNNGLLPARVASVDAEALIEALAGGPAQARVDIPAGSVTLGEHTVHFALDAAAREKLENGLDDIDLTRRHADTIVAWRAALGRERPWMWPQAHGRSGVS